MTDSVTVLFFSSLRDTVGVDELSLSLHDEPPMTRVGELVDHLFSLHPDLRKWDRQLLVAINSDYADRDAAIEPGDEIALMPPVQGG